MEEYLRSLKIQMKSLRRQIVRENAKLQDMSKSISTKLYTSDIEKSVGFMKTNVDHLTTASTKLAQLEDVYKSLMYEEKHN